MRREWLDDILAIAQTGSFSDAAHRRNLTQSAFSRRVQQIEGHLGVTLFDRSRKPVHLRPATADNLDRIARLTAALGQLEQDLRQADRAQGNRISLASQHALSTSVTPAVLQQVRAVRPGLHVSLMSANLDECIAALLARQVDLAITYRLPGEPGPANEAFIETLCIGSDRLVPVVGAAHLSALLAARPELPCITYPDGVFFGQVMNRQVLPALPPDLRPRPQAESALTFTVLELARLGFGVGWVPLSLARAAVARGELHNLDNALGGVPLEVQAARLTGPHGSAAHEAWHILTGSARDGTVTV